METKIARVEADVKHLNERVKVFWDDVKALRLAWTTIIIFIISLIFGGLIWLDNKQETKFFAVMSQLSENNVKIDRLTQEVAKINHEVSRINQTLFVISSDHENLIHRKEKNK